MFFPDRIKGILPGQRVLEVGPGASPHPRADILLEKRFATDAEALGQRGRAPALATEKPLVFYDGGSFPFRAKEFDYVICSHVLEHVADVGAFCRELMRVGSRGYLEFPTVYYDYLYDIPEHVSLLFWQNNVIKYLPKKASGISSFPAVTRFFMQTLTAGHDSLIQSFKPYFFQGFEWRGRLLCREATTVDELCWPAADKTSVKGAVPALIFSKDRAMQLEALLASLFLHCRDEERLRAIVLFASSNDDFFRQYQEVAAAYPQVSFVAENDFSAQVTAVLRDYSYILFLVDDTIFVGDFSVAQLTDLLAAYPEAVGVSLRLGGNTTHCYPLDRPQALPPFYRLGNGFLLYDWPAADGDFAYPLEVSSSCYRAADILTATGKAAFANPNALEGLMAVNAARLLPARRSLVCPTVSLAFSNPVNIVQTCCANRFSSQPGYTAAALAELFDQGRRIDVDGFCGFIPGACHQPVALTFV